MDKLFTRAYCEIPDLEGRSIDDVMGTPIRFIASTEGIKRDGLDLSVDDWDFGNFRKNPVFLWAHNYMGFGDKPPLGRVEVSKDEKRRVVLADVVFDQEDDFARKVERKYRSGFLHAVSVGWDPVDKDGETVLELLDVSGVPIPGDPDALIERAQAGARSIKTDLKFLTESIDRIFPSVPPGENDPPEQESTETPTMSEDPVWRGISAAMVGIFDPAGSMDDETRKSVYILLDRLYRKLGKTSPEFRTLDELRPLNRDQIDGLFLEGEPAFWDMIANAEIVDLTEDETPPDDPDLSNEIAALEKIRDAISSKEVETNV